MDKQESWRSVGQKIRQLRKANQLTLRQLALGCDLSPNAISLVERGKVAPSVATLFKIACALGVPASSLFHDVCSPDVVLHRAGSATLDFQTDHLISTLSGGLPKSPDAELAQGSLLISDASLRQAVLCLCGKIIFEVDEQKYPLQPGDTLTFNGRAFHRWRNFGLSTGVAVMVLPTEKENVREVQ